MVPAVKEWLSYGKLRGLGQWRNSGKGRFLCEILEERAAEFSDILELADWLCFGGRSRAKAQQGIAWQCLARKCKGIAQSSKAKSGKGIARNA